VAVGRMVAPRLQRDGVTGARCAGPPLELTGSGAITVAAGWPLHYLSSVLRTRRGYLGRPVAGCSWSRYAAGLVALLADTRGTAGVRRSPAGARRRDGYVVCTVAMSSSCLTSRACSGFAEAGEALVVAVQLQRCWGADWPGRACRRGQGRPGRRPRPPPPAPVREQGSVGMPGRLHPPPRLVVGQVVVARDGLAQQGERLVVVALRYRSHRRASPPPPRGCRGRCC
jgi:hypothetical protein